MADNIYCGISKVPKNKRRGTAKECFSSKQVRYYGLEILPDEVINAVKEINVDAELIKTKLKGRKFIEKAKALQRDMATQRVIINEPTAKAREVKAANKRRDDIIRMAKNLSKKIRANHAEVERLEEIKVRRDAVLALENMRLVDDTLVSIKDLQKIGKPIVKKAKANVKKSLRSRLLK